MDPDIGSANRFTKWFYERLSIVYLCLVILVAACISDLYSGKIPRQLTGFGMLISQAWLLYHASVYEALTALLNGLMIMVILYPLFTIGALGAGDIKLIMILPAYMNFSDSVFSVFLAFAAGALAGCIKLALSGSLIVRLKNFLKYVIRISQTKKLEIYDFPSSCVTETDKGYRTGVTAGKGSLKKHQIHFSVPVLIGVIIQMGVKVK